MKDLTDPRWIKVKGILFLILGFLSAGLILYERFEVKTAILLGIVVWSFCRFYCFAFYVIEHYVDSRYRFSGLCSFVRYMLTNRQD